jgi:hypothetical protein
MSAQVLAPSDAAKFIAGLPAEEAAALLRGLDLEAAQAILLDMSVAERARLLQHWDESFTVEVGFMTVLVKTCNPTLPCLRARERAKAH